MKRFLAIIFLLLGVFSISKGVAIQTQVNEKERSVKGQADAEISILYERNRDEQTLISSAYLIVGAMLFIIGAILISSKSKSQKKLELEFVNLKKALENYTNVKDYTKGETE